MNAEARKSAKRRNKVMGARELGSALKSVQDRDPAIADLLGAIMLKLNVGFNMEDQGLPPAGKETPQKRMILVAETFDTLDKSQRARMLAILGENHIRLEMENK